MFKIIYMEILLKRLIFFFKMEKIFKIKKLSYLGKNIKDSIEKKSSKGKKNFICNFIWIS